MQNFYTNCGNKIIIFFLFFAKFQYGLGACNLNQWTCDDGTCIESYQQCDGKVNCIDGSDEIADNCIHLYDKCPEYAFRCSYGACITASFRCNGNKDCADGSDELVCTKWRADRWRGNCAGEDDMECLSSKECISSNYLCDGEIHCKDGTDESLEICAGYSCNEVGFHCGYGGCVNVNAKCNGKQECRDGSDEAWALCNKTRHILTPNSTTVTVTTEKTDTHPSKCQIPSNIHGLILKAHPFNTTINPGTWINNYQIVNIECPKTGQKQSNVCLNGKLTLPTCEENRDESDKAGSSTPTTEKTDADPSNCKIPSNIQGLILKAHPFNTTINPGTWINNFQIVNIECPKTGQKQSRVCFNGKLTLPTCQEYRDGSDKAGSSTPTIEKTDADSSNCQIPSNIQGLLLKAHPVNTTINPGTWINNYQIVNIECPKTGQKQSMVCLNGELTLPTCQGGCNAKLITGLSTRYNCFVNDQILDKDSCTQNLDQIPINVTVDLFCNTGFKRSSGRLHQNLRCLPNGEFDGKRMPCELRCGSPVLPTTFLTKSGFDEKPSSVPWNVAIFERGNNGYTYICSGSVVSPNIVISAAQCFYNDDKHYKKPSENYQFIGGKYTRNYTSNVDGKPQIRDALNIHIIEFGGTENNYHDVAVIELKTPFIFNINISAICMPKFPHNYVASNRTGFVTGYGQKDTLERVPMVTEEYNSCKNRLEITDDKFCLNNDGGATVCLGDRGGGYVEKVNEVFQLVGIISFTPWAENGCARNGYVVATNVAHMPPELAVILKKAMDFGNTLD